MSHTEGPWEINWSTSSGNQTLGFHITGPKYGSLNPVCFGSENGTGEIRENAYLIAAAPELLEALIKAEEVLTFEHGGEPIDLTETLATARAAIAKARGQS